MKPGVFVFTVLVLLAGCDQGGEGGQSADAAPAHPGETLYNSYCISCHASGMAGAPRVGDVQAWVARLEKGRDALVATTVQGIPPGMPPKGMCMSCTDEELGQAVDFMIERSR